MRATLCLLLATALAMAADAERVRRLVEELDQPDYRRRQAACRLLREMGPAILPLLKSLDPADPETKRLLRGIARMGRRITLTMVPPGARHALGAVLEFRVALSNTTDQDFRFSLLRRDSRGRGTHAVFHFETGAGRRVGLRPDQIEIAGGRGHELLLPAGGGFTARIRVDGTNALLREPGRMEVRLVLETHMVVLPHGVKEVRGEVEIRHVLLKSEPVPLDAYGRSAAELEKGLRSKAPLERASALAELLLREDAHVLPVFRRNLDDKDLRLVAIQRLGAAAKARDLDLVRRATRSPAAEVRVAAVHALANYRGDKARRRLVALAQDHELKAAAIHALTRHKSAATIDCFIRILKLSFREGPWVRDITRALYDWTGKVVKNRRGEIDAFERWWLRNRARWVTANE